MTFFDPHTTVGDLIAILQAYDPVCPVRLTALSKRGDLSLDFVVEHKRKGQDEIYLVLNSSQGKATPRAVSQVIAEEVSFRYKLWHEKRDLIPCGIETMAAWRPQDERVERNDKPPRIALEVL